MPRQPRPSPPPTLRAALYARKSTEQEGVAEDAKSVQVQINNAKAYALKKGWLVTEHIYTDDGISGAKFDQHRPGLAKLLLALKSPVKPFDILVVSEVSRLGRATIRTMSLVQQLVEQYKVKLYCYIDDREIQLDGEMGEAEIFLKSWAASSERRKASERIRVGIKAKARQGYLLGGRTFGYSSQRTPHGVARIINEEEASVVRQIFTLYVKGTSLKQIATTLNKQQAPSPFKSICWQKGSIKDTLRREIYRGWVVTNCALGTERVHRPDLAIVSDLLWKQAEKRHKEQRAIYLRETDGKLGGRPPSTVESKYLLAQKMACGICGSNMTVVVRLGEKKEDGSRETTSINYRCASNTYGSRSKPQCQNRLIIPLALADQVMLQAVEAQLLHPTVIKSCIEALKQKARADGTQQQARQQLEAQLKTSERKLAHLTQAIEAGGNLPSLLAAVKAQEEAQASFREQLAARERVEKVASMDEGLIARRLPEVMKHWTKLAQQHTGRARQLLSRILPDRIVLTPNPHKREYRFTGMATLAPLIVPLTSAGNQVWSGSSAPTRTPPGSTRSA